jgi:hypothetical protein
MTGVHFGGINILRSFIAREQVVIIALLSGRSPVDCRISRLRFAFSRLRFACVSPGVVCGSDPGSGLSLLVTNAIRGTLDSGGPIHDGRESP